MPPRLAPATLPDDDDSGDPCDMFVRLDSLPRERRTWLVPGRLLAHALNIVEGEKGVGKSTFLAAVVASTTANKKLLGRRKAKPTGVLWLAAEESYQLDVLPRLAAAGADTSRVVGLGVDKRGARHRLTLPQHLTLIQTTMHDQGLSVLIVDPLASFIDPALSLTVDQQIHTALDPLADLCLASRLTIIASRHLVKNERVEDINRGQGGAAVGGVARCVVSIEWPDRSQPRRILRVVACNEGATAAPVEYSIIDVGGAPAIGPTKELPNDPGRDPNADLDDGERDALADAQHLLRRLLADGYHPSTEIADEAERALIRPGTLRRAKVTLKVHSRRNGRAAPPYWEWGPPKKGWDAPPQKPV